MSRFAPALRRVSRQLDLARPARSRVLLELAADLEAVFEYFLERGLGEEEAARRAEERVLGSEAMIRRLGRMHRESWIDRLSERLGSRGGLLLLVLAVAPSLSVAALVAVSTPVATTPVIWLLAVLAGATGAVVGRAGWALSRGRGGAEPWPVLLVLSAMAPLAGLLAFAAGAYGTARKLSSGGPGDGAWLMLADLMVRDGVALLVGLLVGMSGLTAWFALTVAAARARDREVEELLMPDPGTSSHPKGRAEKEGILPLVRGRIS